MIAAARPQTVIVSSCRRDRRVPEADAVAGLEGTAERGVRDEGAPAAATDRDDAALAVTLVREALAGRSVAGPVGDAQRVVVDHRQPGHRRQWVLERRID